jgi:hypothetical protein
MQKTLQWIAGLFVVEIGLRAAGVPIDRLELYPSSDPRFALWQPFTHLVTQGGLESFFRVAIGVLVLVFFLPALNQALNTRQLKSSAAAIVCGAVLIPALLEMMGMIQGAQMYGWQQLLTGLVVLYGLAKPNQSIHLFFVIPVRASLFVWGSLGLSALFFIGDQSVLTAEPIGAWCGAYAWWNVAGPGGRRRTLLRDAARIEESLQRFDVLEGGLSEEGKPPEEWH